jgi:hypothetical protein
VKEGTAEDAEQRVEVKDRYDILGGVAEPQAAAHGGNEEAAAHASDAARAADALAGARLKLKAARGAGGGRGAHGPLGLAALPGVHCGPADFLP